MKRTGTLSLIFLAFVIVVLLGQYYSADLPRSNPVLYAFFPDDTRYAVGYREARFREISPGMTAADVRALLGPPLSIREFTEGRFIREIDVVNDQVGAVAITPAPDQVSAPDELSYLYSEPGVSFDNFYVRTVEFGRDGRVSSMTSELYSD